MTRTLGKAAHGQCPICRSEPGPDCPDTTVSTRTQRRREERAWRSDHKDETSATQ